MTTHITFDMTSVIQMALIALLVAAALRLPPAEGWRAEARRGILRAGCGCVAAIAAWVCVQVAGQALEPAVAPKWAMGSIVAIPAPPVIMAPETKVPGKDI